MKEIITNATGERDTIWLSGFRWGLKKWSVSLSFASGGKPFIQTPPHLLTRSSEIVPVVTLVISHYL